ncbi:putative repeat protein (TIGR03943 family) [Paenibacillus phyllosphaerae]|uniref:Putative repeat protein (TIGR03943 family) n=1 Tax=Paenibacillus phyllosphaerae TaxID=274593 RepID=A0A7W5AU74_9BACL|nr:TIGR03943 family protein [Paenibacillus phyllosphaerae]MBB3108875.1 putative repeat protein (TIGR03943 family) [Paenibacillus phyllosphaerae]
MSRAFTYAILLFPVATGIFLPIQTLDSSFVKAKGFSFPEIDISSDNPGFHQFLKPDMSVYYSDEGYMEVAKQDLNDIQQLADVKLNDDNYLKALESIYNNPNLFVGRTISFNGFVYKGEQAGAYHAFVFRFGFIHCVADSGVFGMRVQFPDNVSLADDTWVEVSGTMALEFYQPFKQTIPVLKVADWKEIETPEEPYVYRIS